MFDQHRHSFLFLFIFLNTITVASILAAKTEAADSLSVRLSGRILLQTEAHGEAWYVNPTNNIRYFLGRPDNALSIMRQLGVGIAQYNLNKIPIGTSLSITGKDSDSDGLTDDFEEAIATNPNLADTDGDGFSDKIELIGGFNPNGQGKIANDDNLTKRNLGKIFLQVESKGQAWYINPTDSKRYYLGSPANALAVMRQLGLGITNANLALITPQTLAVVNPTPTTTPSTTTPPEISPSQQVMDSAATAIRARNTTLALSYFSENMQKPMAYSLNFLDDNGKLTLANLMSGAKLSADSGESKTYTIQVDFPFGNERLPLNYQTDKQSDGKWLISKIY